MLVVVVNDRLYLEFVVVVVVELGVELLAAHVDGEAEVAVPGGIDLLLSLWLALSLLIQFSLPGEGLWSIEEVFLVLWLDGDVGNVYGGSACYQKCNEFHFYFSNIYQN